MQCVLCEGLGCDDCHGRGWTKIESCPARLVSDDVWTVAMGAADAESGFLPEAGGTNSQTYSWLTAWRHFKMERAHWKRRLKASDES